MIRAVLALAAALSLSACAAEGGGYFSGTVEAADPQVRLASSDTLFVLVQQEEPGKPPVAVQRYVGAELPLRFAIGPDDLLRPQTPLPKGPFRVRALVRRTGMADVPLPGDREGETQAPAVGARDLDVVLK